MPDLTLTAMGTQDTGSDVAPKQVWRVRNAGAAVTGNLYGTSGTGSMTVAAGQEVYARTGSPSDTVASGQSIQPHSVGIR